MEDVDVVEEALEGISGGMEDVLFPGGSGGWSGGGGGGGRGCDGGGGGLAPGRVG